jgi:hypothetical protein
LEDAAQQHGAVAAHLLGHVLQRVEVLRHGGQRQLGVFALPLRNELVQQQRQRQQTSMRPHHATNTTGWVSNQETKTGSL